MVRIKHRYLLINILYPSGQAARLKVASDELPAAVRFHQPTPSAFKISMLLRLIQDGVAELFGDYGVGMISSNIKGTFALHEPNRQSPRCSATTRLSRFRIIMHPKQASQNSLVLAVVYLSTATSTAIIRVSRESYRLVWAALSFAKQLPNPLNTPCVIQVVRVSGTIRKSEEAAVETATEVMRKAARDPKGQSDFARQVEESKAGSNVMDVDDDDLDEIDASDD